MRTRAYESSIFLTYANYVGSEGSLTYGGLSVIADPRGDLLARAGRQEQLIVADLTVDTAPSTYLADRRPDLFGGT